MNYKWKRNVKWRSEDASLVICNCKTTDVFEIPLQYKDTCEKLNFGVSHIELQPDLIDDLLILALIEDC
jgi:hypothetical protein